MATNIAFAFSFAFSCLVAATVVVPVDGVTNLKMFIDPRHVSSKRLGTSPCSTTATTCEPPDSDLLSKQGFFQSRTNNADRCLLEQFFPGICQGKYLDVGALDGIYYSPTYTFYKVMGWKGVNIEIDPYNYEKLARNRKDDIANVHAAVCSDPQKTVHYAVSKNKNNDTVHGGVWEYASPYHREQYWPDMTIYDAIPVKCIPLQSILDKVVGSQKFYFDIAILNLSGAEFSALLGIDYNMISFGVLIIEKNDEVNINQQVEDLLHSKGYSLSNVEEKCGSSAMWFIHSNFHRIYQQI